MHAKRLFGALLVAVVVVALLASSLDLLPIAIWLAGRWAIVVPVVELEDRGARAALRRSRHLTRRHWPKVASLVVAGGALVLALGPLIGAVLILATSAPFWLVNIIAGVIYAVTMPFVALDDRLRVLRLPRPGRAPHRGVRRPAAGRDRTRLIAARSAFRKLPAGAAGTRSASRAVG